MPLIDTLTNFRNSVAEVNGFIGVAFQQDASGVYVLPRNHRDFITDSSFLKLFISWEAFLENSFTSYMLGEASILGNTVVRYTHPLDINHARNLLIGTQKYVDWANPEIVRRLCNLHFTIGNPFDTFLTSILPDIFDLKTVRNAAAHLSSTTNHQLDSLATRKLSRPCANITVSDFIFAINPNSATGETILSSYLTILDICAEGIANG